MTEHQMNMEQTYSKLPVLIHDDIKISTIHNLYNQYRMNIPEIYSKFDLSFEGKKIMNEMKKDISTNSPSNLSDNDIIINRDKLFIDSSINIDNTLHYRSMPIFYNTVHKYSAYVFIPEIEKYNFHPLLALEKESKKIIGKSNTYLNDAIYMTNIRYDERYQIYTRLNYVYKRMIELIDKVSDKVNDITLSITDECILFANAFSAQNIGHDISITNYLINYYLINIKERNPNCKIVLLESTKKQPRILEYIEMFIPATQFIFIDYQNLYLFENIHIPYSYQYHINEFMDIFTKTYKLAEQKIMEKMGTDSLSTKYKNKKIFLVKNSTHTVVTTNNVFQCEKVMKYLETTKGYIIINPEKMSLWEIIVYLNNAQKIIVSNGAILYAHQNFFNPRAQIIFITSINEKPYPSGLNINYKIKNVPSNKIDNIKDMFLSQIYE